MKQILFVLALMLILTVCFVGEAFALNHPWTDADNNDGGDEHPWGGDNQSEDPPSVSIKPGTYISFATGYTVVDIIVNYIILDEISTIETKVYQKQIPTAHRIRHTKYSSINREGNRK